VSRDAADQRDATVLRDAANAASPQSSAPGSPAKPQDSVFPATIEVTQRSINIDGEVALIHGMGVSVEIKTGRRRAIDYLLSLLRKIASWAGSER
jgi:hemolysin D